MFGFSKFWESISQGIATKWVERLFSPALLFWGAGVAAWAIKYGTASIKGYIEGLDAPESLLLIVGCLLLVVASAAVIESLEASILRILEGYWPGFLETDRLKRTEAWRTRFEQLNVRWLDLAKRFSELDAAERHEYRRLDRDRALFPEDPGRIMPTRLGNVMAAAELHSWRRYGLASALMWSRLWLLLPEDVRKEITAARREFNASLRACAWSSGIFVWGFLTPFFFAIAAVSSYWSYRQAIAAGSTFGQLVTAAYDLHSRNLVRAFGMEPTPGDVLHPEVGRAITVFVRRGDRPFDA